MKEDMKPCGAKKKKASKQEKQGVKNTICRGRMMIQLSASMLGS
jgi:hypothetical protein